MYQNKKPQHKSNYKVEFKSNPFNSFPIPSLILFNIYILNIIFTIWVPTNTSKSCGERNSPIS